MKLKHKIIITIAIIILLLSSSIFTYKVFNKANNYKECQSVAVINKSYCSVYGTAKENDTNYKYYYKSIKVKETKSEYIIILVDWESGTPKEQRYDKSKCVVIVSY